MDFKFNAPPAIGEVLKINNTLTAEGYEKNVDLTNKIRLILDEMGKLSAMSQGLKTQVTSVKKLVDSDHVIYIMIEHNTSPNFTVIGILKMGWIKMHLCDKNGFQSEAIDWSCLLDFYIHETRQRKGHGKRLMDYMLQDTGLEDRHLAIEKPNKKILDFMRKHYQLSNMVNQANDIVIYEEFYHDTPDEMNNGNSGNRITKFGRQPTYYGQQTARQHRDTKGNIIEDAASVNFTYNHDTDLFTSKDNEFQAVNPRPHP